jgi:hypothetical protein
VYRVVRAVAHRVWLISRREPFRVRGMVRVPCPWAQRANCQCINMIQFNRFMRTTRGAVRVRGVQRKYGTGGQ